MMIGTGNCDNSKKMIVYVKRSVQLALLMSFFSQVESLTGETCTFYRLQSYSQAYSCSQTYYTSCGLFGWSTCTRYRSATCYRYATRSVAYTACCTGYSDDGNGFCAPVCDGSLTCSNGGTCIRPNYCGCPVGYYPPSCNACPVSDIEKCERMTCDAGPTNKLCLECEIYVPSGSRYSLTVDGKHCTAMCDGSSSCPNKGSCTYPNFCTCPSGYYSPSCAPCPVDSITDCTRMTCDSGATNKVCTQCRRGYILSSNQCSPLCFGTSNCPNGGTCISPDMCSCPEGFKSPDCSDIKECDSDHDCDHNCMDSHGSYNCTCNSGFVLQADGKSCKDINECEFYNGGCDHNCFDTSGSYYCTCNNSYILGNDNRTCEETSILQSMTTTDTDREPGDNISVTSSANATIVNAALGSKEMISTTILAGSVSGGVLFVIIVVVAAFLVRFLLLSRKVSATKQVIPQDSNKHQDQSSTKHGNGTKNDENIYLTTIPKLEPATISCTSSADQDHVYDNVKLDGNNINIQNAQNTAGGYKNVAKLANKSKKQDNEYANCELIVNNTKQPQETGDYYNAISVNTYEGLELQVQELNAYEELNIKTT